MPIGLLANLGWAPAAQSGSNPPPPGDDYWYNAFPGLSLSGFPVGPNTAMRQVAVYAAVRIIADSVGSLPLLMYRRQENGDRERMADHPLYPLLHDAPNSLNTAMGWRQTAMAHILLRGFHLSERIFDRAGALLELRPVQPDAVTIDRLPNFRRRFIIREPNKAERVLTQDEVFFVPGLSLDGVTPLNPIEYQRETLGLRQAMDAYIQRFYRNTATPTSGVISHPTFFKNEEEKERFRNEMQRAQTAGNQHKLMILTHAMTYQPVAVSNTDAQFLEFMKYSVTDICRIFRVPPHMMADLDRATFSNIEHQSLEFVIHTLRPWLVQWEQSIQQQLLADEPDIFAEHLVDGLLRGDQKSRYEAYSRAIGAGWMNRNEPRRFENLNSVPELEEFLQPVNMAPAGSDPLENSGAADTGGQPPEDEPGAEPKPPNTATGKAHALVHPALRRFAEDAAARMLSREKSALQTAARRKANDPAAWDKAVEKLYAEHAAALQDALHIPESAAQGYCGRQHQAVMASGLAAVEAWGDDHLSQLTQLALEAAL